MNRNELLVYLDQRKCSKSPFAVAFRRTADQVLTMPLGFVRSDSFLYEDGEFADCQLFHFRLTDSALRDLEHLAGTLVSLCVRF